MKTIPLTQSKQALVDDCDFERASEFKWHALHKGTRWYAVTNVQRPDGTRTHLYLHQLILPAPHDMQVDHGDGDGLNCQRYNLRIATSKQNNQNRHTTRGLSQYKGVSWNEQRMKWRARITVNGKKIWIGSSCFEESCALAYRIFALDLFGEFAANPE